MPPPRGRHPRREYLLKRAASAPLLSSCRPARLHHAPIIPRRHASINTHLPCNTVHGEALLLLQIWHVHSIQISNLDVVGSLRCSDVPLLFVGPVQTRLNYYLRHILHDVNNPRVLIQRTALVYREK